jgi:RNA-directed DNA polymerase
MSGNYVWGWDTRSADPWSPPVPSPYPVVNPGGVEPTLEQVVEMNHLLRVYDRLRREAGQAPGVDGIGYDRMGRMEAASVLRPKAKAILAGRWLPDPIRSVRIPKMSGGHRVLRLPTVADRVLFAAINDWLTEFWERRYSRRSHGFRPRHSRYTLLAALDHEITTTGMTTLVVDDVRTAFDTVSLSHCLTAHRQHLRGESLLTYITTALRGNDPRRTTGIDQGNAYSPSALNVLLHGTHDLPLDAQGGGQHPHWFRYADNLIYLTSDAPEGRHVRRTVQGLLRVIGMALKGTNDVIVNLQQNPMDILGLTLRVANGQVAYAIPETAWETLSEGLLECHQATNPPEAARTAIRGWVEAQGPALENLTEATLARLYRTGLRNGFRELDGPDVLARSAGDAYRRWTALRDRVRRQTQTAGSGTGTASPPTP